MHSTVGLVFNQLKNGFNRYLATQNAAAKPGLQALPIDDFAFGGVSADATKRTIGVYSNGKGVYQSGWGDEEASSLLVVVDMFLLDTDDKLIYKYAEHLINFLDSLHIGVERKVTDADVFQKQSGAPCERVAATLTIIIDTMEDDDE